MRALCRHIKDRIDVLLTKEFRGTRLIGRTNQAMVLRIASRANSIHLLKLRIRPFVSVRQSAQTTACCTVHPPPTRDIAIARGRTALSRTAYRQNARRRNQPSNRLMHRRVRNTAATMPTGFERTACHHSFRTVVICSLGLSKYGHTRACDICDDRIHSRWIELNRRYPTLCCSHALSNDLYMFEASAAFPLSFCSP